MLSLVPTDGIAFASPGDGYAETVLGNVSDLELALWVVVVCALVLDVALTIYGLSIGLVERNPIIRTAIETYGFAALGVAKAVALAVAVVFRVTWPEYAVFAPLGLAIPWLAAAGINLALIASV